MPAQQEVCGPAVLLEAWRVLLVLHVAVLQHRSCCSRAAATVSVITILCTQQGGMPARQEALGEAILLEPRPRLP